MGQGRRRWDEPVARAVLADWEASGLTLAAFARQRGLDVQRLQRWRSRLAGPPRHAGPPRPPRFVEVVASTPTAPPWTEAAAVDQAERAPVVVLWPGGLRLLVPPDALGELIDQLARVLPC